MENRYTDYFGLYHDKPTQNGNVSGNPMIYTAFAKKLELDLDMPQIQLGHALTERKVDGRCYYIRHPYKPNSSPASREEILGRYYLGLTMNLDGWNFSPFSIPKFNPIKLVQQLWELRPNVDLLNPIRPYIWKHRNYFWENNLNQLYRFAFSIPLVDRYSILNWSSTFKFYKPTHLLYLAISKIDSLLPSESGIRWLKYGKSLAAMRKEFPQEDHPLRTGKP